MRYLSVRILLTLLALGLLLAGCAVGGGAGLDPGAAPSELDRDQMLSEMAACHLLRVAQTADKSVTDATVLNAARRFDFSLEAVVTRANQLVQRYHSNGAALGRRAVAACNRLAALTQIAPALVRFEESGQSRSVWLRVSAQITKGFADRVIRELRTRRAVGLIINSPGGSVFEARKLGRYLRANGLRAAVDQTCVSACIDVLAGGSERYATHNARLGIHQSHVPGRYSSHEGGQLYVAESFRYLREMGVDPDVAIAAASIPNNRILLIPLRDALATRLLTGVVERL
ncbi:hypothetical protein [uncultured Thiodictyon sp.]|uniref:COG3904 family protein n=1 Tax=uncultured Thiodictyon sp. TaxID=1846217 RepID=UPI0025CE531B|nr:hypothetical protein [uncultured Thiodictyon sp.]